MKKLFIILLSIVFMGCVSTTNQAQRMDLMLARLTAGNIPCLSNEITIKEVPDSGPFNMEWFAFCDEKIYICSRLSKASFGSTGIRWSASEVQCSERITDQLIPTLVVPKQEKPNQPQQAEDDAF